MTRSNRFSFLLIAAATLAVTGCATSPGRGPLTASGYVEATEVRVATKIGGTLERLAVDEGDPVIAGREIARMDTVDLRLAMDSAKAERDAADAELRLRLAGARREEIAQAEARVEQARANLDAARRDLKRMEALLAAGSGTEKGRDDARTRRDIAAARLREASEFLRKLRAGSRREEIAAARARRHAAEARIAQVEQQIRDATILSPVGGVVTSKLVEQGELLQPGTGLLLVTDLDDAWLNVYVSDADLPRVRIGQPVEVVTDDGTTRRGTVGFIASEAEFTPKNVQTREERARLVFRIKVRLDNRDRLFKPGMPAEARFLEEGQAS